MLVWLWHVATARAPLRYQLLWLVAGPLAALVHECGHALAAQRLTPDAAEARVRAQRWALPLRSGCFHAVLRPFSGGPSDEFVARTAPAPGAAVIAAGPLASLAALVLACALAAGASPVGFRGQLLGTFALCCLSSVLNLVPLRLGGLASDGAQLVRALRRAPAAAWGDPNAATSVAPPGRAAG
jgi:hypothetical protein